MGVFSVVPMFEVGEVLAGRGLADALEANARAGAGAAGLRAGGGVRGRGAGSAAGPFGRGRGSSVARCVGPAASAPPAVGADRGDRAVGGAARPGADRPAAGAGRCGHRRGGRPGRRAGAGSELPGPTDGPPDEEPPDDEPPLGWPEDGVPGDRDAQGAAAGTNPEQDPPGRPASTTSADSAAGCTGSRPTNRADGSTNPNAASTRGAAPTATGTAWTTPAPAASANGPTRTARITDVRADPRPRRWRKIRPRWPLRARCAEDQERPATVRCKA